MSERSEHGGREQKPGRLFSSNKIPDARLLLEHRGGIRLSGTELWLDASSPRPLCFVSHAHSDHIARHDSIICTPPTARFCRERAGIMSALEVPYRKPFSLGELKLELFDAGHILGSAQLLITLPKSMGGFRVGYTGDFCMTPSITAGSAEQVRCDVLVMEATFGKPHYVFPPRAEVLNILASRIDSIISGGGTPVIIAYPLGKSQEVIRHLDSAGFRVRAHHSVWENCRIYGEFGVPLSKVRKLRDGARRGEVVVAPHSAKRTKILQNLKSPHLVAVTGWAVDQGAEYRMGVDEALPLSDHADFPALVEYARASGAEKVFVVHGSTVEFVHALREAGIDAEPLVKPRQMELF